MLILQSDLLIVLLLNSPNLEAYFLVVKVLSVFAFISSINLPRIFSLFLADPSSDSFLRPLRNYRLKAKALPVLALSCSFLYLILMEKLSFDSLIIMVILSIALHLRIMSDLYSCILQASGRVRELSTYLPFQFIVTVFTGYIFGNFFGSVGVALAQLFGFSLIAYPWLRNKFNSLLEINSQ